MRMKELSEASGVPVATIKFYLRERLLPAGERTQPNQSQYTDAHLGRIRLIRALIEVGGLSVAGARGVIAVLDLPGQSVHNVLGLAQHATAVGEPGQLPVEEAVLVRRDPGELGLVRCVGRLDVKRLVGGVVAVARGVDGSELDHAPQCGTGR